MENVTNAPTHPPKHKFKPKVVVEKKPVLGKQMPGAGFDDSAEWKIKLSGSPEPNLATARRNLIVNLYWNFDKISQKVIKADVILEQVGVGYDTITYKGKPEPNFDNNTKRVHYAQHTIAFQISFTTTAAPLLVDLG